MKHIYILLCVLITLSANAQNCGTATNSTSAPISFGPPAQTVNATVTITEDVSITDINITINLLHSFLGDLNISIQSPLGTQAVLLLANTCGGDDNIQNAIFDDDGATIDCTNGIGPGTFAPETPLSIFNGENAMGTWTLTIIDTVVGDDGSFQNFTLEFCTDDVLATPDITASTISVFPNPTYDVLNFNLGTLSSTASITIFNSIGQHIKTQSISNQSNTIDVSALKKGLYLVSIATEDGTLATKTFVKN